MKKSILAIALLMPFLSFGQWLNSSTAGDIYYSAGKVGVGTGTPSGKFHVYTTNIREGIWLSHNNSKEVRLFSPSLTDYAYNNITRNGDAGIFFYGAGGNPDYGFVIAPHRTDLTGFRMSPSGNVSINTSLNTASLNVGGALQFPSVAVNRKVVLYESLNNDHQFYGFGVNAATLRYQANFGASHVFYTAENESSSRELLRINANGVNVSNSTASQSSIINLVSDLNLSLLTMAAHGSSSAGNAWMRPNGASIHTTSGAGGPGGSGGLSIAARHPSGIVSFHSGGDTERMRITETGNVGIGTTAPTATLDVIGVIKGRNFITVDKGGSYRVALNGQSDGYIIGRDDASVDKFLIRSSGISYFNGGSVGIGTTAPGSYKLAVEGKIGAREVVVTVDPWADNVFESNYKLMPLSEVETFIKENKHLPEIPSAEEVKENGVALGEMNALLLKKIEELTLHLIEQNKLIEEQQKTIREVSNRVLELEGK